jgi:hypothetical protein
VCRVLGSGGEAQWDSSDVSDVPASILKGCVCHSSCGLRLCKGGEAGWLKGVGEWVRLAAQGMTTLQVLSTTWYQGSVSGLWKAVRTRCIRCQPPGARPFTTVVEAPPDGGGWSGLVCLYLGGQLAMMTRRSKGSRWLVLGCASLLLLQQQQRSTCCRVAAAGPDPSP